MKSNQIRQLALGGIIAAMYAALTLTLAPLSFGPGVLPIELRVSEALTLLPFLFPAATPGVFIGCLVANLASPYGALDIVAGSLATGLAALCTSRCKNKWVAALPPVLCNTVIIGAVIGYSVNANGFGAGFIPAFLTSALQVGLGEALVCYTLGILLINVLSKVPYLRGFMRSDRLAD